MADSNINDLVRVRIGDVEKNMGRAFAESLGDDVEILDQPTSTPDGRLREDTRHDGRPIKPKTSVATEAAAKKTASAETSKEQKA